MEYRLKNREMPEDWWELQTALQAQLGCGSWGRNEGLGLRGRLTPLAIRKPTGGGDGALPKMRNCSALGNDFLVAGAVPQVQDRPRKLCEVSRSCRTILAHTAQRHAPKRTGAFEYLGE